VFQELPDKLIAQAYEEGFIQGSKVAIDATHVEARDASSPASSRKANPKATQSPVQMELAIPSPEDLTPPAQPEPTKLKKRGRKKKRKSANNGCRSKPTSKRLKTLLKKICAACSTTLSKRTKPIHRRSFVGNQEEHREQKDLLVRLQRAFGCRL
jgi:hypothetical protein